MLVSRRILPFLSACIQANLTHSACLYPGEYYPFCLLVSRRMCQYCQTVSRWIWLMLLACIQANLTYAVCSYPCQNDTYILFAWMAVSWPLYVLFSLLVLSIFDIAWYNSVLYCKCTVHNTVYFVRSYFASAVGFPLYPEIFYIISQWPAAHQNHCGRCRFEPRTLAPEVWCATDEPPHLPRIQYIW